MDWLFENQTTHQTMRVVGMLLTASITGAASMVVYRWLSPNERMKQLKASMKQVQDQIQQHDGENFGELWGLVKQNLALAWRQLGHSIGPSLVAGLPVLLVGFNLDVIHRQTLPAPPTAMISRGPEVAEVPPASVLVDEDAATVRDAHATHESVAMVHSLEYCPYGPGWLRSWMATFVLGSTLGACTVQFSRGVH